MSHLIAAIDPSIRATGVINPQGEASVHTSTKHQDQDASPRLRIERYDNLAADVVEAVEPATLVAIERYAYNAKGSSAYDLAEFGGILRKRLIFRGIQFVEVPPQAIKTYATGKGNASKTDVLLAAVRRLNYDGNSEDEADALWLWHLTQAAVRDPDLNHLGLPATHTRAIEPITQLINQATT